MAAKRAPYKPGDRVGAVYMGKSGGTVLGAGIILRVEQRRSSWYADIRTTEGDLAGRSLHPDLVEKASQLSTWARELFEPVWAQLESPGWKPPVTVHAGE